MLDWLSGLIGSAAIAGFAHRKRALSRSGAIAAVGVGTAIYALGGAAWCVPLLAFFISSSLLSWWRRRQKAHLEQMYEKSGCRDAGQVLANGGIGALVCMAHALQPQPLWWFAYVGIIAAVNADTWATEIGGTSRKPPRSILSGKVVPAGTSGGVTARGLMAAAAGALWIGIVAAPFGAYPVAIAAAFGGGLIGAASDSLLGATVQRMNVCVRCGREIEAPVHCGERARPIRGVKGFNNDAVNALSSAVGGMVGALSAALLAPFA